MVDCFQQMLPFIKVWSLIVESEYRLNILDAMELLIALLKKEISIIKLRQAFGELMERKKLEMEKKKTRKSMKNVRKK